MNEFKKAVIEAIIHEIDHPLPHQADYERSPLGGMTRWSRVTGGFIPVTQIKKSYTWPTIGRKKWWSKYGEQAREYARRHRLAGPRFEDVGPAITPDLIKSNQWTQDDPDEVSLRNLIVEETLQELLQEGRIKKHPARDVYRKCF